MAALRTQWRGGSANKLTVEQRRDLVTKLDQSTPAQVIASGIRIEQGEFWTVSDLKIVVAQGYGVIYQRESSYRSLLYASGLSYQKVETVSRSQPGAIRLADFEAELEKK